MGVGNCVAILKYVKISYEVIFVIQYKYSNALCRIRQFSTLYSQQESNKILVEDNQQWTAKSAKNNVPILF